MAAEDLEWERSKISNQDVNLMKKLGLMKKEGAIRFPNEESYPSPPIEYRVSFVDHLIRGLSTPINDFLRGLLFVYGVQLHQLTPNSILHVVIFITLCECFLGVPPNWALWKRIFCLRRNGSHNIAYKIGGVVICVRSNVEYFDVKFPDSVQGWRKRWLYVHEESANSVEHNIAPFDASAKILRRCSWDTKATEEEKTATEALMSRIYELQNTRTKEFSGIQITAYFLRIRVQPLQARKNPLWTYASEKDANRLSKDLSVKDLEKLIRRISSLSKKDPIPSSCRVDPYSATNLSPSGDEDENPPMDVTARTSTSRTLVISEAQPDGDETSTPQQDLELTAPVVSPRASSPKRARVEPAKEPTQLIGGSTTPSLDDPLMKEFIRLGTQFVGYRDLANKLEANLAEANKRADALALKLEQSEKARRKAESSAAVVEDLRKILHDAETSLSDNITQQTAREEDIISRLESQSRRFVRRTHQEYELESPEDDRLLDALSLLEINADEARQGIVNAESSLSRLFPFFFAKKEKPDTFAALAKCFNAQEDLGHGLRQEGLKIGVEGTIALVADSQQNVDWAKVGDVQKMETKKWQSLIKAAKPNSKKILAFLGFKPTPAPSSSKLEVK
ncbi:hypothetical protein QYE76_016064 [Lolium multiflorum]|uniref:Transposase (putative) gypsy type domain-containing protein n=1 Tax=Lolium multiflorum TaxID=4521 RepID=A0AAD8U605_LOLMU|nr:hypothetical protein QYE76_016064 [Lolium multiflorum]